MRWVCDQFLNQSGLSVDFAWIASNAELTTFVGLRDPTYQRLTLEFLSTFNSNILVPGADHFCSFTVGGHYEQVSLETFCNIFNFRNEGIKSFHKADAELAQMCATWESISILGSADYLKKKMTTTQTPPFVIFLY